MRDFSSLLSRAQHRPTPPRHRMLPTPRRFRPTRRWWTTRGRCCSSTFANGREASMARRRPTICATRSFARPGQRWSRLPHLRPPRARPNAGEPTSGVRTSAIPSPSRPGSGAHRRNPPRICAIRSSSQRRSFRSAPRPVGFRFSVRTPFEPGAPKHPSASCSRTASRRAQPPTANSHPGRASKRLRRTPSQYEEVRHSTLMSQDQQSPIDLSQFSGPHVDGYKNPSKQVSASPQPIIGSHSSGGHSPMGSSQFAGPQPLG